MSFLIKYPKSEGRNVMISDVIKDIRRRHYLSQAAFAKRVGVTQGTVSQWENGLTRPNLDQLKSISAMFGLSVDALLNNARAINLQRKAIPILGNIACGELVSPDTNPDGYTDIPDGVSADFALRCNGDSMNPTFIDGDLVLIRQQPEVEPGQIAAVNIAGETTLKHVYPQNGGFLLVADNPAYQPIFTDEQIVIHGLAVGYVRMFG